MKVVGIDLSGPSNLKDTCLALFEAHEAGLDLLAVHARLGDGEILQVISGLGKEERIVIGIDAPLSYQPGGGDRESDRSLRRRVREKDGGAAVMTPTMTRMVYLTLRGITLARMLETLKADLKIEIVEVHPGACMLIRGAPKSDVSTFKREVPARQRLLGWLGGKGLSGLARDEPLSDHFVASCAAALGAWQWALGKTKWLYPANPPAHPYDFAC